MKAMSVNETRRITLLESLIHAIGAAVRGVDTGGKESPFNIAFVHHTHYPYCESELQ
jgi:hypothetical protein